MFVFCFDLDLQIQYVPINDNSNPIQWKGKITKNVYFILMPP